jgi:uncharacterized protein YuzE
VRNLRVEITDDAAALYIAVDPDGLWAKTTQPDDLITIDWDRQGRVIGIEAIGSAAYYSIAALLGVLDNYPATQRDQLQEALYSLAGTSLQGGDKK